MTRATEELLLYNIEAGNTTGVKRALAAGRASDGDSGPNALPLVVAAKLGRLGIVDLLLGEGANLGIAS